MGYNKAAMEKVSQNNMKKKVFFLITKSNWGEKVRGTFARLAQLVCKTSERVHSVCKQVLFYCTQLMFVCEHPNKAFVCKSKTETIRPSTKIQPS